MYVAAKRFERESFRVPLLLDDYPPTLYDTSRHLHHHQSVVAVQERQRLWLWTCALSHEEKSQPGSRRRFARSKKNQCALSKAGESDSKVTSIELILSYCLTTHDTI